MTGSVSCLLLDNFTTFKERMKATWAEKCSKLSVALLPPTGMFQSMTKLWWMECLMKWKKGECFIFVFVLAILLDYSQWALTSMIHHQSRHEAGEPDGAESSSVASPSYLKLSKYESSNVFVCFWFLWGHLWPAPWWVSCWTGPDWYTPSESWGIIYYIDQSWWTDCLYSKNPDSNMGLTWDHFGIHSFFRALPTARLSRRGQKVISSA